MALCEKQIEIELLFKKKRPLQWAVNCCKIINEFILNEFYELNLRIYLKAQSEKKDA